MARLKIDWLKIQDQIRSLNQGIRSLVKIPRLRYMRDIWQPALEQTALNDLDDQFDNTSLWEVVYTILYQDRCRMAFLIRQGFPHWWPVCVDFQTTRTTGWKKKPKKKTHEKQTKLEKQTRNTKPFYCIKDKTQFAVARRSKVLTHKN